MPVSVHIADVGVTKAAGLVLRPPKLGDTPGLRHREAGLAKPFGGERLPRLQLGRACLIAYWDDDASIDRFLDSEAAAPYADGWRARLEPLRAYGPWPGLDEDLPRGRKVPGHTGPSVVITLANTRLGQLPRFIPATRKAEASVAGAPGLRWGTALAKPPYLATVSVWDEDSALSDYAYPQASPHAEAMRADRAKAFHHQMTFVRFAPYELTGVLAGRNPVHGDAGSTSRTGPGS